MPADSGFKFFDETINQLKLKIPVLRQTLEPSTDIWGNEIKQAENVITRALETFIAPYSAKKDITEKIDLEIKDVYSMTGEDSVIPSIPKNYTNYKGEKYEMSARQYTEYKKTYGQMANGLLNSLFKTDTYLESSYSDRADMINKVYDYARDEANKKLLKKYGVDYTNATSEGKAYYKENPIVGAIENDVTVDEYAYSVENPEKYSFFKENDMYEKYVSSDAEGKRAYNWAYENPSKYKVSKVITDDVVQYRKYTSEMSDIRADKDENGKTIVGSAKEKKAEYIFGLDLDYGQKIIMYRMEYDSQADKDTYNADIVEYLDSRDDISYEDMVEILEELDMKVYPNGRVTW